jgi:hypothetical protein
MRLLTHLPLTGPYGTLNYLSEDFSFLVGRV